MLQQIVFFSLAGLALLSALLVVTLRNTVHSALFLGLCLAALAGLFAQLGADFLFACHLLVYVGGIALLIMFVVMLLGRASDLHLRQINNQWMAALLICAISLVGLWKVARLFASTTQAASPAPTTSALGALMLSDYAVPFELVSLVPTAALLGAVFFSHTERRQGGR